MLRTAVLERCGQTGLAPQPWEDVRLDISKSVAAVLEERRILEDDLRQVIFTSKEGGRCFVHGDDGRRIASAELGEVTFWVEYREERDTFTVLKAWSHRMRIAGGRI